MHNNCPHEDQQNNIHRTASGSIDTDHYLLHARAERSNFLSAVFACILCCGWNAWGCVKLRMEGQSARRQLSALSERELKDIGLAHGDIEAVSSGAYATDLTRCAHSRERLRGRT